MKGAAGRSRWGAGLQVLSLLLLAGVAHRASAALRYALPEETPKGSRVGNVVADLGLELARLPGRRLRVVSRGGQKYFEADLTSGLLFVNERLDREALCGALSPCAVGLELVLENPLELYSAAVEIQDINDNDPAFPSGAMRLEVSESVAPGARFPLESAQDPDVGINSLQSYQLSANPHFVLEVKTRGDGSKYAELVLEKELDREEQPELQLVLTALDGGSPPRSASVHIHVDVLDANDNAPVFNQSTYRASVRENTRAGALLVRISALDLDEGPNGDIVYSVSSHTPARVRALFALQPATGELRVTGPLDYEAAVSYEIYIQAKDKGPGAGVAHCKVLVEIIDENDNAPEITVRSVYSPVPEDAPPGTVIALLSVSDLDSGDNGLVTCLLPAGLPFALTPSLKSYYTLQTRAALDRELVAEYNVTVTARDAGSPPLWAERQILVHVSDVNDNAPKSPQLSYDVFVAENNPPGTPIFHVSAWDADLNQNARLAFSLLGSGAAGRAASRHFSISAENGTIYALRSLDHEDIREFAMTVQVRDGGVPALATNLTVSVFVTDVNDNAPRVLYPPPNASRLQGISPTASAGHLATKLVAWDADSGYNAWLSYTLLQAPDPSLFSVGLHSGEIRTARQLREGDAPQHALVISVTDHGEPALSSSATLTLTVAGTEREGLTHRAHVATAADEKQPVTFYLLLAVVLVSGAAFVTAAGLGIRGVCRWRRSKGSFSSSRGAPYRAPGPFSHIDAVRGGLGPPSFYQQAWLTTDSRHSALLGARLFAPTPPGSRQNTVNAGPPGLYHQTAGTASGGPAAGEQAQPNPDWRFSQAQRPGTSGSQNGEEGGTWPNNQFDTEMLQAMILASANEAADGNSTLGGGAGTMGLSTRYGPQFTLQHVPDYRQNVYIPGSTATLSNAAGKRDGKSSGSSSGNKKKSGKKEKK